MNQTVNDSTIYLSCSEAYALMLLLDGIIGEDEDEDAE